MSKLAIGPLEYFLSSKNLNKQCGVAMKKKFDVVLTCAFSLGSSAWSQDKKDCGGTENDVADWNNNVLQSQKQIILGNLAPALADKFVEYGTAKGNYRQATILLVKCESNQSMTLLSTNLRG